MHKKRLFYILFGLVSLAVIVLSILQLRAKQMVEAFLDKKIPAHIDLNYSDININILTGSVDFEKVRVDLSNRDTTLVHSIIDSDRLTISGLGYFQFFLRNTINADEIRIENPDLIYYQHRKMPKKDTLQKGVVNLLKTIVVDKITIVNGKFTMFKNQLDSVNVQVEHLAFDLYNAKIDPDIIQRKIPVEYDEYSLQANGIFIDLGAFEKLNLGQLEFVNKNIRVRDINLASKFDRHALSEKIRTERDFVSLIVPKLEIQGIDFGFRTNRFFVSSTIAKISTPDCSIYRDKLVADDKTHKKLYATRLRELPFDLKIDSILVNDGHFVYEERVSIDEAPGKLVLTDLNIELGGLRNNGEIGVETGVDATALLMGSSPMTFDWKFDVMNEDETFIASGELSDFKSSNSNSFLRPSLNIEAEGEIQKLYFTVSGNDLGSTGDFKMKYHDFKIDVLGKDGKKTNRFFTFLGNIFLNDGSNTDTDGYRHGKISATRDPTKSFFNYLWLNIKDGLISTLTGDGKKE